MSICPVSCIVMQEDSEGFAYPHVDKDKCINCSRCESVCPVINRPEMDSEPEAYLARNADDDILMKATSGGVFTGIAKKTIEDGGVAYGAVYDSEFDVKHDRIDTADDIERLPGSKYVQSDMGDIFVKVRKDLQDGRKVVFCGTPCQAAGLKNFIGSADTNLLTVDLVCHGVPSPKLWREYLGYIEERYGKARYINFRSKKLGYHVSVMEEVFENGHAQTGSARTNLMSKCFFKNAADRPICYECPFKTISRSSDLTIFDGWNAEKYISGLKDDDRGYTIILAQSDKGKEYLKDAEFLKLHEIDLRKAIALDGKMAVNSVARPECRESFYRILEEKGIEKLVAELFPIKKHDMIVEKLKIFLYKTGLLPYFKKLKG